MKKIIALFLSLYTVTTRLMEFMCVRVQHICLRFQNTHDC